MPAEDCVRREQGTDLIEDLSAQDFPFYRQAASLVVVQDDPPFPQLLLEHVDFRPLEIDDLLLLLVDPAREDHQQKLPGVEDETHESPLLKSMGETYSIGWPPAAVHRPKRASAASAQSPRWLTLAVRLTTLAVRAWFLKWATIE